MFFGADSMELELGDHQKFVDGSLRLLADTVRASTRQPCHNP